MCETAPLDPGLALWVKKIHCIASFVYETLEWDFHSGREESEEPNEKKHLNCKWNVRCVFQNIN